MQTTSHDWPVVILCGGQGTRLREETEFKPKPMVTIGGQPILVHIMKIYAKFGYKKFILCLGYKGEMIKQFFTGREDLEDGFVLKPKLVGKKNPHDEWEITFADTGLEAQTGARTKKIEKYVHSKNFMLTYGDGVADIDIPAIASLHLSEGRLATLSGVKPPSRFGIMDIEGNKVVKFREKPLLEEYVNGGFYAFGAGIFGSLSPDDSCVLEHELAKIATDGQLSVYKHDGFWHMMDNYKDYMDLNKMWDSGNAKWKA